MKQALFAAVVLLVPALPSHALLLSFDNGSTTAGTGRPIGTSFTLDNAYLETTDEFGDPLPVAVWTPIEPATIGNPADAGYGEPVSGSGALNAEFDQILFTFESPVFLRTFSTILDDSTFGNLGESRIQFFGSSDQWLGEIVIDQTQPMLLAELSGAPLSGVKKILLPSGAYYDEVTLNVPESGPGVVFLAGMALAGALRVRRGVSRRAL
jgi:hypothetical protein